MSLPHVCDGQGWLVAPESPLPGDLTDWCWPARQPSPVGCNHLVCFICSAVVKQRPGWLADTEAFGTGTAWRDKCAALHDAESWEAFSYVRPFAKYRVYVCRCSVVNNDANRPIVDPNSDDAFGNAPAAPYRCAGHPAPDLPFRLHGLEVDATSNLHAQIRRVLSGELPPSATAEELTATNLVVNLRRRVEDTPAADRVNDAVIRCLDDEDPSVASGAIAYTWNVPDPGNVTALLEAAKRHLDRWLELPDPRPFRGTSVGTRALATLGMLSPRAVPPEAVIPWLREAALQPAQGAAAVPSLLRLDRKWLEGSLSKILAAQRGDEQTLLLDLVGAGIAAPQVVRGMIAGGSAPERIRAAADKLLWGDDLAKSVALLDAAKR